MSVKEKFQEYIYKQDRKLSEQDTASRYRLRNRKYHGYFEGYTEYTVTRPSGKQKICRVYTAEYFRQPLTAGQAVLLRAAYALLFLLAGYLLISGSIDVHASCNYVWYVTVWQACCIACLFWILTILCGYLTTGRSWKIHDYRVCHCNLRKATLAAAAAFILLACAAAVCMAVHGKDRSLYVALRAVLGAAAIMTVNRIENSLEYQRIENPVKNQYAGGVEIK